jgi:hypothetical protein
LPTPTRAAIETNADGEWHRREGEAAMTEPIETSKAWGKSWSDREAAGPDKPTPQTGAAEASGASEMRITIVVALALLAGAAVAEPTQSVFQ